jgi:hypothetical protein
MPQVIFLTVFLGLVSGVQLVNLQVDPAVRSVRLELGGRPVATLAGEPWSAQVDFGSELIPRELVAIGYDGEGAEIARAAQLINLPRPMAELAIVIKSEKDRQLVADLVGRHVTHSPPTQAALSMDGEPVRVGQDFRARLPQLDWSYPHIVWAEMHFEDGQTARREAVIEGGFSDSVGSELTPVLVTTTSGRPPESLEGCFSLDGAPLRVSTLEKTTALVILVKDPDPRDVIARLHPMMVKSRLWWMSQEVRRELQLDRDTIERIQWAISRRYISGNEPASMVFNPSNDTFADVGGMSWLLTREFLPSVDPSQPRQFADAVAVAGVTSLGRGSRRAVVLLLSRTRDQSRDAPAVVRRYLEGIGVPLFVWSVEGPRPDLADSWGPVEDISTTSRLHDATTRLNRALREQRIVWVAINPLAALRIEANERCGLRLVARSK